jgi:hypothetical protein
MSKSLNYTYEDKKKIYNNIEKFKKMCDKDELIFLGKLIISGIDKSQITEKKNGIWFDLCILNDETLYKIDKYLKKFLKNINNNNNEDIKSYIIKFKNNNINSIFSKKEKKIIDKIEKSYMYQ